MSKKLVTYFSASGATKKVASTLANVIKADLYEIKPAEPYKKADLNWMNPKSRSSLEMKDPSSRPALADHNANIEAYDEIYLGFPIWWYVAPHIINTFLESYDFSGKKIIVFATSGSSDFGNTIAALKPSTKGTATFTEGKVFKGLMKQKQAEKWAGEL